MKFQDEYIEHWATIFQATSLFYEGVTFEEFLTAPWDYLYEHGQEGAPASMEQGFRPLLPEQARIARRMREHEEELDACPGLDDLDDGEEPDWGWKADDLNEAETSDSDWDEEPPETNRPRQTALILSFPSG